MHWVKIEELVGLSFVLGALIASAPLGCHTVEDDGGGGKGSSSGGKGSSSGGTSSGGTSSGGAGQYVCCLNDAHYACPDKAALDQCIGFDIDGCLAGCNPQDFECIDQCFQQVATASHDPSACQPDATVQCGGSGSSSSGSGSSSSGGTCSQILSGCDYDSDCCSNNCTDNTCYGNAFGDPCEYDSDCDSNNCYEGMCQ